MILKPEARGHEPDSLNDSDNDCRCLITNFYLKSFADFLEKPRLSNHTPAASLLSTLTHKQSESRCHMPIHDYFKFDVRNSSNSGQKEHHLTI